MRQGGSVVITGFSKVGVILVNYRDADDTCECIESLRGSDFQSLEVYVIDNDSGDGSCEAIGSRCPEAKVIPLSENIGFGGANNVGMERAFCDGCEAVLLLNNDTIVDKRTISVLAEAVDDATVTVPLMLYFDEPDTVWYGGGHFDHFGIPRHDHFKEPRIFVDDEPVQVDFATGCCIFIPKHVYERVGGFDESYFLYWEDADLSLRFAQNDVHILFCPKSVLWHKVSASTGGEGSPFSYYYETRNRLYAIDKFRLGFKTRLWAYLGLLRGVFSQKPQYENAFKAWCDYRKHRFGKGL